MRADVEGGVGVTVHCGAGEGCVAGPTEVRGWPEVPVCVRLCRRTTKESKIRRRTFPPTAPLVPFPGQRLMVFQELKWVPGPQAASLAPPLHRAASPWPRFCRKRPYLAHTLLLPFTHAPSHTLRLAHPPPPHPPPPARAHPTSPHPTPAHPTSPHPTPAATPVPCVAQTPLPCAGLPLSCPALMCVPVRVAGMVMCLPPPPHPARTLYSVGWTICP
jgi:hypothetical protein